MTMDPTAQHVVHTVEGVADVAVERHAYAGDLGFDLYRPPNATAPSPAVVFVSGYPDPGMAAMLGKPLKDWASYGDWARMIAASGIAAIAYLNREPGDARALVRHLREHAGGLGIDPARIAVWACSGNAPTALALLADEPIACAALLYPMLLDLDGATDVAEAAKQFFFAVPPVALDALRAPMLIVRAGRDATPGLEPTLQRFLAAARARGLPVTLIDHADAPHAFDLVDDSDATRAVIDQVLGFLVSRLRT